MPKQPQYSNSPARPTLNPEAASHNYMSNPERLVFRPGVSYETTAPPQAHYSSARQTPSPNPYQHPQHTPPLSAAAAMSNNYYAHHPNTGSNGFASDMLGANQTPLTSGVDNELDAFFGHSNNSLEAQYRNAPIISDQEWGPVAVYPGDGRQHFSPSPTYFQPIDPSNGAASQAPVFRLMDGLSHSRAPGKQPSPSPTPLDAHPQHGHFNSGVMNGFNSNYGLMSSSDLFPETIDALSDLSLSLRPPSENSKMPLDLPSGAFSSLASLPPSSPSFSGGPLAPHPQSPFHPLHLALRPLPLLLEADDVSSGQDSGRSRVSGPPSSRFAFRRRSISDPNLLASEMAESVLDLDQGSPLAGGINKAFFHSSGLFRKPHNSADCLAGTEPSLLHTGLRDEQSGHTTSPLTLLGIGPLLPDLSDPIPLTHGEGNVLLRGLH